MPDVLYVYVCGGTDPHRHELSAPHPLTRCYGMVDGKPCTKPLKQTSGPRPKNPTVAPEKVSDAIAKLPEADRRALAPMRVRGPVATKTSAVIEGEPAVAAYIDGASLAQVAVLLKCSVPEARAFLVARGVTIRGRGRPSK